jgi:hypothetical protein
LDAVILAGGKSERLRGIVPPYHKPFLVVNGRSLLVAAVEEAQRAGASRIVVVATGENAMPVWQLVREVPRVTVVLDDHGVGNALAVGLNVCREQRVLVLMSDNVFAKDDVPEVAAYPTAIGVQLMPARLAQRYTRLIGDMWLEGGPSTEHYDDLTVWCGPLVVSRNRALAVLPGATSIGHHLNTICPGATLVPTGTRDIGTPEAAAAATKEA